jgi:hypothetical protein
VPVRVQVKRGEPTPPGVQRVNDDVWQSSEIG